MSNTPPREKLVRQVISNKPITSTPSTIPVLGLGCKIQSVSGNTWINPLGTASSTDGASYLLPTGATTSITVLDNLSLVSDATGSTVQIMIYE